MSEGAEVSPVVASTVAAAPPEPVCAWADDHHARKAEPCGEAAGYYLVLPPSSELPPVCLKCGAHEQLVPRRYFARASFGIGRLAIVVAPLVYLLGRWRFVRLSLCDACDLARTRDGRRRRLIGAALFLASMVFFGLVVQPLQDSPIPEGKLAGVVAHLLMLGLFFPGLYLLYAGARAALNLWVSADWRRRVHIGGVDPSIRAAIIALSAHATSGGARAVRSEGPAFPLKRSEPVDESPSP